MICAYLLKIPVATIAPMKRGLKVIASSFNGQDIWLVATIAPMKRGLKVNLNIFRFLFNRVATIAPMKRGLKVHGVLIYQLGEL